MTLDEKGKATLANAMKERVFKQSIDRIIVSLLRKEPEMQLKPFRPDADMSMQEQGESEEEAGAVAEGGDMQHDEGIDVAEGGVSMDGEL